uniref:Uncharacterized protein n=2 Tax=Rhipicephalus microplus TaxID=6941 RepID=A0A6M2CX85_RHIMP
MAFNNEFRPTNPICSFAIIYVYVLCVHICIYIYIYVYIDIYLYVFNMYSILYKLLWTVLHVKMHILECAPTAQSIVLHERWYSNCQRLVLRHT